VGRSPPDRPRDGLGHTPPIRAHPPLPCNEPPQREGRSRRIRSDPSSRCLRLGNEPWRGQTELPRHRHSSAKRARCSPAVRSALVPASETPCFGQVAADDHRSDFSARSGRSLARVLCFRDLARRAKRRSRFERSRRARAAGRRPIPPDPARLVQPCTAGVKTNPAHFGDQCQHTISDVRHGRPA